MAPARHLLGDEGSETPGGPYRAGDNTARYLCPRCGTEKLEPVSPELDRHLVVDRCPVCEGFWLDPGELEAVQGLSLKADEARLEHIVPIARPADWSWLRWVAYCLKKTYT